MKEASAEIAEEEEVARFEAVVQKYQEYKFYGFSELYSNGRKFGFVMRENELVSVGEHLNLNL